MKLPIYIHKSIKYSNKINKIYEKVILKIETNIIIKLISKNIELSNIYRTFFA